MQAVYQQYLDNLAEAHALVKKNLLTAQDDKDALLQQIQEHSRRAYQIRQDNDRLLKEILTSRSPISLTEQDVEDLKEFADKLFIFSHQNDIGVAYKVHELLYRYAEIKNDRNLRIRQLYHMGTALFYMNPLMTELGINLFGEKVTRFFTEGAEYISQYREINDAETQGYILRCFGNLYIADEKFNCRHQPCIPHNNIPSFFEMKEHFDKQLKFFQSSEYRALTPDYPWDSAIYNIHFNISTLYQFVEKHHPPEILEEILKSANYTYNHQEQLPKFKYSTKQMRVAQIYATVKWKAGLISTTELADAIYELIEQADPNDFSLNGITLNLQMPLHFEYAFRAMNNAERALYREKMEAIDRNTRSYLLRAPHNEYSSQVTNTVGESIRYRAQHNLPLQKKFFDSLLFCHPPTYIHVRMTAALSRMLFLRQVEISPETLIGLCDIYDVDELRSRQEELAERIYLCALYHDVGKTMLLDYIGIYERSLLPEEFEAIKLHTSIGSALLEKTDPKELSVVALHHHRHYNEMAGYPDQCRPCQSQFKAFVDIVSVADSIDAATDNIGRCYCKPKTFSTLLEELRSQSGTRYSPHVVGLFDDEAFACKVEETLHQVRMDIYFETYGPNRGDMIMI